MIKHSEEFKREAVRIALTSGLSRERVAKDLGIGKSTLGKWIAQYRPTDLISAPRADLARENERLRLENRVLKEERDILKNRHAVVREPVTVRFAFVESWRHVWPVETIRRMMRIGTRGYRSGRSRPISQRCRTDMKVLAHIREQYSLSLGGYSHPRMAMEFKEAGLAIGERRVGRLMKISGLAMVKPACISLRLRHYEPTARKNCKVPNVAVRRGAASDERAAWGRHLPNPNPAAAR